MADEPIADDGLPAADPAPVETPPAGDKPAAAPAGAGVPGIGDDGLPLEGDGAPAGDKPAAVEKKEFTPDPAKSDAENEAAKKAFDREQALDAVPADKYDFTAFAEEHGVDSLDQGLVEAFTKEAKEHGLTQRQAEAMARVKLADNAAYIERIATVRKEWLDTSRADKEIGGANWNGSLAAGRTFIKEFGSPELTKLFKETGLGGHPEIMRCFAKAGKVLGEGSVLNGGGAATTSTKSTADVFYGD